MLLLMGPNQLINYVLVIWAMNYIFFQSYLPLLFLQMHIMQLIAITKLPKLLRQLVAYQYNAMLTLFKQTIFGNLF
jgi:hypothetical protein